MNLISMIKIKIFFQQQVNFYTKVLMMLIFLKHMINFLSYLILIQMIDILYLIQLQLKME